MTIRTKVVLTITHIVVLAIGIVVGAKLAGEGMKMTSQGAMISHYGLRVDIQRNEGDRDAYRKALIAYLGILDDIIQHPSDFFDPNTTAVDKMFVYERLSRLEKEANNSKKADEYMSLAVQTCGSTGWKDCSIERINKVSKKLEESGLVSPKLLKKNISIEMTRSTNHRRQTVSASLRRWRLNTVDQKKKEESVCRVKLGLSLSDVA